MKALGAEHATGRVHYDAETPHTGNGFQVTRYSPTGTGWVLTRYKDMENAEKVAAFLNTMIEHEDGPTEV